MGEDLRPNFWEGVTLTAGLMGMTHPLMPRAVAVTALGLVAVRWLLRGIAYALAAAIRRAHEEEK